MRRCAWCGCELSTRRVAAGATTCGSSCADAERELRRLYAPPSGDELEDALRAYESDRSREADDA